MAAAAHKIDAHASAFPSSHADEIDNPLTKILGELILEGPDLFDTHGSFRRKELDKVWVWLCRDVEPKLKDFARISTGEHAQEKAVSQFAYLIGELVGAQYRTAEAKEQLGRLGVQLGGEAYLKSLGKLEIALSHQAVLARAAKFGKSLNDLNNRDAMAGSLGSLPSENPEVARISALTIVPYVRNMNLLVEGMLDLAQGGTPNHLRQANMGPMVDAILGNARHQIGVFKENATVYGDFDLVCNVLIRYHKLLRCLHAFLEVDRREIWFLQMNKLVGAMSELVRPLIENADSDVLRALRKARAGEDRIDEDAALDALNHLYLLEAARRARDTLAVSTFLDTVWKKTGRTLEQILPQLVESLRVEPGSKVLLARFDLAMKLASIRFSQDYVDVFKRAKDKATNAPEFE